MHLSSTTKLPNIHPAAQRTKSRYTKPATFVKSALFHSAIYNHYYVSFHHIYAINNSEGILCVGLDINPQGRIRRKTLTVRMLEAPLRIEPPRGRR